MGTIPDPDYLDLPSNDPAAHWPALRRQWRRRAKCLESLHRGYDGERKKFRRACAACGEEFDTSTWPREFLTGRYYDRLPACMTCSAKHEAVMRKQARREALEASAPDCVHCGEPLPLTTKRRKFCGVRCRVAHHRIRP